MTVEWTSVWQAENFPLWVENAPITDAHGRTWTQWRVNTGVASYAGAIAVPICPATGRILLVHQERIRVDRSLWELPRGMTDVTDADPVATALRELHEETGFRADTGEFLGFVYPDSGLLASKLGVVRIEIPSEDEAVDPRDGEVDDQRWVSPDEFAQMMASGDLTDALSLSALALAGCFTRS